MRRPAQASIAQLARQLVNQLREGTEFGGQWMVDACAMTDETAKESTETNTSSFYHESLSKNAPLFTSHKRGYIG
jgi:hypothetical protein